MAPQRVILDTDLGDDIDDTWALGMLLRCPELKLELLLTAGQGCHDVRAKIAAKLFDVVGLREVPIGLGVHRAEATTKFMFQEQWVKDMDLENWSQRSGGCVVEDGVGRMIGLIMSSDQPMTIIAIGPMDNIATALKREPKIAEKARFVSMLGSINKGYFGLPKAMPEFNVAMNPSAVREVLSAPWKENLIAPLDACATLAFVGEVWNQARTSNDPLAKSLVHAHEAWYKDIPEQVRKFRRYRSPSEGSTYLFDCAAVHLAYSTDFFDMKRLHLRVTDEGMTEEVTDAGEGGIVADVALACTDQPKFIEFLLRRITKDARSDARL